MIKIIRHKSNMSLKISFLNLIIFENLGHNFFFIKDIIKLKQEQKFGRFYL